MPLHALVQRFTLSLLGLGMLLMPCRPAAALNSSRFEAGRQTLLQRVAQEQTLQDTTLNPHFSQRCVHIRCRVYFGGFY
ncbi:MAG: hypothetical protein IGS03_04845 [Candidatus Sericytochromatia bacterium]|nr:hypothetical protein [Candidatus Sericytochromatia bacterium]